MARNPGSERMKLTRRDADFIVRTRPAAASLNPGAPGGLRTVDVHAHGQGDGEHALGEHVATVGLASGDEHE